MPDIKYLNKRRKIVLDKIHKILEDNPFSVKDLEKQLTLLKIYNQRILYATDVTYKQHRFKWIARRFDRETDELMGNSPDI